MRALTVISNYNEEGSIEATIADLRQNASIESDILVIDNASTDRSMELIKASGVDFLRHPVNTGGSSGVIKTALRYAWRRDYDLYCHMDGDNQHCAAELIKIASPVFNEHADIVIGSRFIEKKGFQSLPVRRVGIALFSRLVSALSGQDVTDLTSGFRAYGRRAISFFAEQYPHEFEPCVQMLMVASYAGLRIGEAPVVMKPRLSGKSEINLRNAMKFPLFGMVSIIGTVLQRGMIMRSVRATER